MVQYLQKIYPSRVDSIEKKLARADEFRDIVKSKLASGEVDIENERKVLIVTHGGFGQVFMRPKENRKKFGANG